MTHTLVSSEISSFKILEKILKPCGVTLSTTELMKLSAGYGFHHHCQLNPDDGRMGKKKYETIPINQRNDSGRMQPKMVSRVQVFEKLL